MLELQKETDTCPSNQLIEDEDYSFFPFPSLLILDHLLTDCGCLFFIRYIFENTLKSCWFLVQIDHVETNILEINSKL